MPENPSFENTQNRSAPVLSPIILGDLSFASPTTQTTVGGAGGASALPATPTGYLVINLGNTSYGIPFYALT
jgi:hypothetical protein